MSLRWHLRPVVLADILPVIAFERDACARPEFAWSADNYRSSFKAGYWMRVLTEHGDDVPLAVCVATVGVGELHLLNIAVARPWHGQGVARHLLQALIDLCHAEGLSTIWLEVRQGNARARCLYQREGFVEMGVRKRYYPAPDGREDAVVMKHEVRPHAKMD